MEYSHIKLNRYENGYEKDGQPLFEKTFLRAMSFHKEGFAAVQDYDGAYHIDTNGNRLYKENYIESFGFYDGIATVRDSKGYFHINTEGKAIHNDRMSWSGNFQEGICTVSKNGQYFHISKVGSPIYSEKYEYAGDFRYGIAVVKDDMGFFHINLQGKSIGKQTYQFADVFHKGFAVVKDSRGYFHINLKGESLYQRRFQYLEPFYNGWALAQDENGTWGRISEYRRFRFLTSSPKVLKLSHLKELQAKGYRVSLVFRHAERFKIDPNDPDWGNSVALTTNGIQQAEKLGMLLRGFENYTFYSSPLLRCRQTLESSIKHMLIGQPEIVNSSLLGDPGAYWDGTPHHEEPMKKDYIGYCEAYMEKGKIPGMLPLEETSKEFMNWIHTSSTTFLNLFCTHDLFVAMLLDYLGLRIPNRQHWVNYIEGFAILTAPNGNIDYQLFQGMGESLC